MQSGGVDSSGGADAAGEALRRRGRRMLLTEAAFARMLGATMAGLFLTAFVLALGGGPLELALINAAAHIGAAGVVLSNPLLNRVGSRRKFCLITLGGVRALRIVIAALPLLIYVGLDRTSLLWPVVACRLVSRLLGFSGELSRRSWIADLVAPQRRGMFLAVRVMIGAMTHMVVLYGGGRFLDFCAGRGADLLVGPAILFGFGGLMGWIGWAVLWRTPEPPMMLPRRRTGLARSLVLPWRHPRFRPLIITGALAGLATSICAGFFDMYMRKDVGMSNSQVAAVNIVGLVVAVAGAPLWGAWADRRGTRRVLTASMIVKGVFPALWLAVSPAHWYVAFAVVLARTFNSAQQMSYLRLAMNMSPARNRAAYLAMHTAMMSVGASVGALIGGSLARALEGVDLPVVAGVQLVPLHACFLLSAVMRLSCTATLRFIREPRWTIAAPAGRA